MRLSHESTASLKRIHAPVLIVCGKDDFAFPLDYMQEMAALIEKSSLKIYKRGHTTVFLEKRFVEDVREFTSQAKTRLSKPTIKSGR